MPVQQQTMSDFAKRLGARVATANAEHKDKPVDTGNRRLPAGIRDGIAKLSSMYTKEQTEDNGKTPKGETFFVASAITVSPTEFNKEKIAGLPTRVVIPLCDIPAKGMRKAVSFSENWYDFQNLFKLLGIMPPSGPQYDVTDAMTDAQKAVQGVNVQAYYFAAMKALTDPQRIKTNPVYISFSTRGWTPPPTQQQPKPEEMVFEEWHGIAQFNGQVNPAAGMQPATSTQMAPATPPTQVAPPAAAPPVQPTQPAAAPPPAHAPSDQTDLVAALVETALGDPEGATEDGQQAAQQLEEMAWANGWSNEQTKNAADWGAVGEMALSTPPPPAAAPERSTAAPANSPPGTPAAADGVPAVGSKWNFCKRTKDGGKLKNNKGEEFPPQEVAVTSVDAAARTCTVSTVKDNKPVVDIRSKKPIEVKWEWLEPAPAY